MTIHTPEEIDKGIDTIDDLLLKIEQIPVEYLDGLDMLSRNLMSIYALSSDLVSSAKYHELEAQKAAYSNYEEKYTKNNKLMPPSIIRQIADSKCAMQTARWVKAERQNKGISHSLEMMRSLMSKGKAEMEFVKRESYQNTRR